MYNHNHSIIIIPALVNPLLDIGPSITSQMHVISCISSPGGPNFRWWMYTPFMRIPLVSQLRYLKICSRQLVKSFGGIVSSCLVPFLMLMGVSILSSLVVVVQSV